MAALQPDMMHFGRVANQLRDQIFNETLTDFSENLRNHQQSGHKIRPATRLIDAAIEKFTSQLNAQFPDPEYTNLKTTYILTRLQDHYENTLRLRLYDLKSAPQGSAKVDSTPANPGIKV